MQILGTYFVTHALKGASEAYGGLRPRAQPDRLDLPAHRVTVFAVEVNVVAQRHLWPRALLAPFTDQIQLTPADKRAYTAIRGERDAQRIRVVDVDFGVPQASGGEERPDADEPGVPVR